MFNRESHPKPSFVTVTGWGVVPIGINYQPQLVSLPDFFHWIRLLPSLQAKPRGAVPTKSHDRLGKVPGILPGVFFWRTKDQKKPEKARKAAKKGVVIEDMERISVFCKLKLGGLHSFIYIYIYFLFLNRESLGD